MVLFTERSQRNTVYSMTHIFKRERKGCIGGSYRCKEKKLGKVDLKFLYWFLLRIYNWWVGVVASLYILYILSIFLCLFSPAFITLGIFFLGFDGVYYK